VDAGSSPASGALWIDDAASPAESGGGGGAAGASAGAGDAASSGDIWIDDDGGDGDGGGVWITDAAASHSGGAQLALAATKTDGTFSRRSFASESGMASAASRIQKLARQQSRKRYDAAARAARRTRT
jgi:hypothetical protein